jgi:hypothetical protein
MKHTPGPWRVHCDRWVKATRGDHDGEILVAPTYWMEHVAEEAAANARLIAAAPEYHAATENVLAEVRLLGSTSAAHVGGLLRAILDLQAVHTKATGATP